MKKDKICNQSHDKVQHFLIKIKCSKLNGVFKFFLDKGWVCEIKNRSEQKIIYKKTAEWYIEWQWVARNGTLCDNKWQRVVQPVTTNDSEWQRTATSGTTNDTEWQRVVQPVTTSATTSANKWQRITTSHNEWWRVEQFLFLKTLAAYCFPNEYE